MIKKVRKRIVSILVLALLAGCIFPNGTVSASETGDAGLENTAAEETTENMVIPEDTSLDTGAEDTSGDSADALQPAEEQEEDPAIASGGLINYVGVDLPYLEAPDEQNIIVSFGDGTENIASARLICEKSDGTILEIGLNEKQNEIYLFKQIFEESQSGVYRLLSFSYVQDDVENTIEFSEIGIDAMFGVNEVYPGYEETAVSETADAEVSAEDLEISVVNLDSETIDNAEVDIEEAIEETTEQMEEEEISASSDNVVSKAAKKMLSSVADIIMPASTAKAAGDVVVVLDPGHGGSDPGAGANGLTEKDINLSIALACKKELEEYNDVKVYMTRETDVYVGLEERVQKAKAWGANVFVSLHMNSAVPGATGVEVYYPNSSYNGNIHAAGQSLSAQIKQQLTNLGLYDRGIKIRNADDGSVYADGSVMDYYSVIRNSKLNGFPGIIVEHAFLTNANDAAKLKDPNFIRQLGVADATGIANYFGLTKGPAIRIENKDDFDGVADIRIMGMGSNAKAVISNENGTSKEYPMPAGREEIRFNVNDYGGARGTYIAEVFNSSGGSIYKISFYVSKDTSSVLSVIPGKDEMQCAMSIQFADMPSEVKQVQFAIWSDKGGQDDLVWYNAAQNPKGTWKATADIKQYHKTAGNYNVHVYVTFENGVKKPVKATSFTIMSPQMNVKIQNFDGENGTYEVVITDIVSASGVLRVQVPVWCAADQSDIRWYDAEKQSDGSYKVKVSMSNHKYRQGEYKNHVYLTAGNGIQSFAAGANQMMKLPDMEISSEKADATETSYNLKVSNVEVLGVIKEIQFATWSEKNGQDDIVWYRGNRNALGEWTATANIKNHKTAGTYNVHVYATLSNGAMTFLGTTTFVVTAPEMKVKIQNLQEKQGTYEVVVSGIKSLSGVSGVQVPVWCAADQSDIRWYDAEKQNDGSYKAKVSMANHKYSQGEYKNHVYLTAGNGVRSFVAGANQMMKLPDIEISSEKADAAEMNYNLKVSNVEVLGVIKEIQFATWSEKNGQDDIVWYRGNRNALGEWTTTANIKNHRTAGTYNVHVYATLSNGAMTFLGTTTFTVTAPEMEVKIQNLQEKQGTYEVVVSGIKSLSGVSGVQVPVWCASDQSDIRWYDAEKQGDGSYKVKVSMSNHKYSQGEYKNHVYLTAGNQVRSFVAGANQMMKLPDMEISSEKADATEMNYNLKVSNVEVLGVIREVQFATWSEKNGQDDIVWYRGSQNALGEWTAIANIKNHRTEGTYNVHVYAMLPNGVMTFLGATTFEVTSIADTTKISVGEYNDTNGSFKVVVSGVDAAAGISNVQVPVWCSADQSDIHWYDAVKQENGSYTVNVDPVYHKYNSGEYKIHVYVTTNNGIRAFAGQTSQLVSATEYYTIMGDTTVSIQQMVNRYNNSGYKYPYTDVKEAPNIEMFCQIYFEEAQTEGVRAEVAFAQAMHETGWLQFGRIVQPYQFNFAGIGAIDGNAPGNCASFSSIREGIRAQIQHLKAYASTEPLVNVQVDPRFHLVTRNSAIYVEWLGVHENPYGKGWASAERYGYKIVDIIRQMKAI